jgi:hypothetical protein
VGVAGIVFALFAVGYILGVGTSFMVLKQPQGAYEDAVTASRRRTVVLVNEGEAHRVTRLQ